MAQSQVIAPPFGDAGRHWEPAEDAGEPQIDIWSQLPPAPFVRPTPIVTKAPPLTDTAQVLSAWRAAERQLDEHIEASPMRSLLQSEIARLRAEYQSLFARKR